MPASIRAIILRAPVSTAQGIPLRLWQASVSAFHRQHSATLGLVVAPAQSWHKHDNRTSHVVRS